MEGMEKGLQNQQACESASKIQEEVKIQEEAKRFQFLSIGCFLYALFYTFCLYRNNAGITYPFFIGGTLYFFGYYSRKYGATAKKDNIFLMVAMMISGTAICMTDSWILIGLHKLLAGFLLCVLLLHTFQEDDKWSVGAYLKAVWHIFWGSLGRMFTPLGDVTAYAKYKKQLRKTEARNELLEKYKRIGGAVVLGILISIPILFFVLLLLCSADMVFFHMVWDSLHSLFVWEIPDFIRNGKFFGSIFMAAGVFLIAYGVWVCSTNKSRIAGITAAKGGQYNPYIGITCTVLIAVVYCLFSQVQIFGLFMGKLALPEGCTYAGYAREGFFQLLIICFFNVCLVLGCLAVFEEHKVLKGILTLISVCTYVMIASSAYRMILYIGFYHMTFLRAFVLWALLMIAVVMAGVIWYIYHRDCRLFRYVLVCVTVGYLCFSCLHPDYWIARYNVSRLQQGEEIDMWYLFNELSLDAAPVLAGEEFRKTCEEAGLTGTFKRYQYRVAEETEDMHIRNYNISRAYARWKVM